MKAIHLYILLILCIIVSINCVSAIDSDVNEFNQTIGVSEDINENLEIQSNFDDKLNQVEMDDLSENENNNSLVIYIGQNSNDGANGSYQNPYNSFDEACERANGVENVTLKIFSGTYLLGPGLTFNTSNLYIFGLGDVVIKSKYDGEYAMAFGLSSANANCTMQNITFDSSDRTYGANPTYYFMAFNGDANLVSFINCTFIMPNSGVIGYDQFNSKFIYCTFKNLNYPYFCIGSQMRSTKYTSFEYCVFSNVSDSIKFSSRIYSYANVSFDSIWYGQNSKLVPLMEGKSTDRKTYSFSLTRYAIFNVTQNYLGSNQYEIVGRLTWNGSEDQDGMENFHPMVVTLTSETGDIASNVTLVNGNFRTIYTSSSVVNKIKVTLDSEEKELSFNTVNITASDVCVDYGSDQNITVNFSQVISDNVTIVVSNSTFNKTYIVKVNGSNPFTYTIPDRLKAGTYDINILLNDTINNLFGSNSTTLTVSKVDIDFDNCVEIPSDAVFGQTTVITVSGLPVDISGIVTVQVGDVIQSKDAVSDMAFEFDNLNATDSVPYDVTISYGGSDKYNAKEKVDTLSVDKAESTISINNAVFTYGDIIAIPFNMTNAKGVTVTVLNKDGKKVANTLSESNIINLDISAGDYTLIVTTVVDTNNYNNKTSMSNLSIHKANSTLEISNQEFIYASEAVINAVTLNSTGNLYATLIDENNNEIAVKDVTGNNITLPLLDVGKYTLNITTNVDENHTNVTKSATITIIKSTPLMNVTVEPAENITAKDNPTLTVKLPYTSTGEVIIKVNGKKVHNSSENKIIINLNNAPGDYVVEVIYSGDKNYECDGATKEFTISKAETSITAKQTAFEEGNASTIEVTIVDINSGIVLVDVEGKKFYGEINKGKSNIILEGLPEGNYTANIKFFGDELYKEATCTASVKVSEPKIITELKEQLADAQANATQLKEDLDDANAKVDNLTGDLADANARVDNLTAQIEAKSNVSDVVIAGNDFTQYALDYNAGERGQNFTVQLTEVNGNVLANKTILIGYNGKTLERVTNATGHVSLQINLRDANRLTFAVTFLGDENYKANMSVYLITIKEKPVTITAKSKTYKASVKTKKYTVTLKTIKGSSADGKTYFGTGKKVTLTINGKTYTAKINSKGKATFKITKLTKKGKFTATVKFAGDKTYKAVTKKAKITIK